MSLVGLSALALMGQMQPSPKIDCETAMQIGRNFVNKNCDSSDFVLTECRNQVDPKNRYLDGWSLKFCRNTERFFTLQLSHGGQVKYLEHCGDLLTDHLKEDNSWHQEADSRGLKIIRSQGYALPLADPIFQKYNRSVFFPICVNGIPFVTNTVGFAMTFSGKDLKLVAFSRHTQVPPVNAKTPLISSSQALAEIKRNHPSDPDYESKMTATKNIYGTPELRYFAETYYSDPGATAKIVWLTVINTRSKSTRYERGSKSGCIVDALTGKEIILEHTLFVN